MSYPKSVYREIKSGDRSSHRKLNCFKKPNFGWNNHRKTCRNVLKGLTKNRPEEPQTIWTYAPKSAENTRRNCQFSNLLSNHTLLNPTITRVTVPLWCASYQCGQILFIQYGKARGEGERCPENWKGWWGWWVEGEIVGGAMHILGYFTLGSLPNTILYRNSGLLPPSIEQREAEHIFS